MNLEKKYANKMLLECCYKSGSDVYHQDIKDEDTLMFFLYEVYSHEYLITDDGIAYIKERFGLERVYELIKKDQAEGVDWNFKNQNDFKKWLRREPYIDPDDKYNWIISRIGGQGGYLEFQKQFKELEAEYEKKFKNEQQKSKNLSNKKNN